MRGDGFYVWCGYKRLAVVVGIGSNMHGHGSSSVVFDVEGADGGRGSYAIVLRGPFSVPDGDVVKAFEAAVGVSQSYLGAVRFGGGYVSLFMRRLAAVYRGMWGQIKTSADDAFLNKVLSCVGDVVDLGTKAVVVHGARPLDVVMFICGGERGGDLGEAFEWMRELFSAGASAVPGALMWAEELLEAFPADVSLTAQLVDRGGTYGTSGSCGTYGTYGTYGAYGETEGFSDFVKGGAELLKRGAGVVGGVGHQITSAATKALNAIPSDISRRVRKRLDAYGRQQLARIEREKDMLRRAIKTGDKKKIKGALSKVHFDSLKRAVSLDKFVVAGGKLAELPGLLTREATDVTKDVLGDYEGLDKKIGESLDSLKQLEEEAKRAVRSSETVSSFSFSSGPKAPSAEMLDAVNKLTGLLNSVKGMIGVLGEPKIKVQLNQILKNIDGIRENIEEAWWAVESSVDQLRYYYDFNLFRGLSGPKLLEVDREIQRMEEIIRRH